MPEIDWDLLDAEARRMTQFSYVPYSSYPVGAAALVDDGRIVSGCNVENAGYGVALCAECGLISELVKTGGGSLLAVTCVNRDGNTITPCGRCRQLLNEHAGPDLVIKTPQGVKTFEEMLPQAFGPKDLENAS